MSANIDQERILPLAIDPLMRMAQEMSVEAVMDILADLLRRKASLNRIHLSHAELHSDFRVGKFLPINGGSDGNYELKIDVKGGRTQLSIHLGHPVDDDAEREIRSVAQLAAHRIELLVRALPRNDGIKKIDSSFQVIEELVGASASMENLRREALIAARSDSTVLIEGETGTGKELVARAIHRFSERAKGGFVPVNCGAIPENLIESELFGYEKGAFTGADKTRKGRFELAHGGTLFLDEVGELTIPAQVKLLRILQEREFERLGGVQTIKVDVRVVAATNRNLWREVMEGRFREDLYHRLNILYIRTPALRDHSEDIPLIIMSRLEAITRRLRYANNPRFAEGVFDLFLRCPWPGNVRALEAAIERLAARAGDGELISVEEARHEISEYEWRAAMMSDGRSGTITQTDCHRGGELATVSNGIEYTAVWHPGNPVQRFFDKQLLGIYKMAVNLLGCNHSEVARFLGMDRKTLLRWLQRAERRVSGH